LTAKLRCSECGKEKRPAAFTADSSHLSGYRSMCKACKQAASNEESRLFIEYRDKCRAAGDGYDTLNDRRALPDEARLLLELVLKSVKTARSMSMVHRTTQRQEKKESIEWLLGFDCVDMDVNIDGCPRWTFGACRLALRSYGIDMPNDNIIKDRLTEWAAEIGYEIDWNALDVPKEKRLGLEKTDNTPYARFQYSTATRPFNEHAGFREGRRLHRTI